jgi:hypothetical protein
MTDRPPVSGEPLWCRGNCLTQHAHRYGPPVSGESSYEARLSEAILNGTDSDTGDLWIHRDDVHLIDDAIHEARATPPSLDVLAEAIHGAMCEVSHHDSMSRCKNQRKYELVAESVHRRLTSEEAR